MILSYVGNKQGLREYLESNLFMDNFEKEIVEAEEILGRGAESFLAKAGDIPDAGCGAQDGRGSLLEEPLRSTFRACCTGNGGR